MPPAILFSQLTIEFHEMEIRTAFLFTFNASKLVVLYIVVAYLLNLNGVARIPLGDVGFGGFLLSFGIFLVQLWVYVLGFKNRRHRYFILSLGD